MISFKINKLKSQLPLKIAKGTAQERINKAEKYTSDFFENLTKETELEDVTYAKFSKILKKTSGGKIGIEAAPNELYPKMPDKLADLYNENAEKVGYYVFLRPKVIDGCKIAKINARNYMHQVYNFFYEILNPKLSARKNKIINNYETPLLSSFYDENILGKNPLKAQDLKQILKGRKNKERINILQYFRYKIAGEKNAFKQADIYIQKIADLYAKNPAKNLLLTPKPNSRAILQMEAKQKIIEEELIKALQQERKFSAKGK